jgi:hypothetical protein
VDPNAVAAILVSNAEDSIFVRVYAFRAGSIRRLSQHEDHLMNLATAVTRQKRRNEAGPSSGSIRQTSDATARSRHLSAWHCLETRAISLVFERRR